MSSSKAPQLTSISAPPIVVQAEDTMPDYSQGNWRRFGGIKPPQYLPVKYGYNHLIDLRTYSVLVPSVIADGTIDISNFLELSQGLDKLFKLEYIEYLIYSLLPVLANVNWCILKSSQDNSDYKLSIRLRTYAIFDPWSTNIYKTKTQRTSAARREKIFSTNWKERVTNNLMLANWIMQDGSRDNVLSPNIRGSMSDNRTNLSIGSDVNTLVFANILRDNYGLPVFKKQGRADTNVQLVFKSQLSTDARDMYTAQSCLYRHTKPFLVGGMSQKVVSPEAFGYKLLCDNDPGLAVLNNLVRKKDVMPSARIELAEEYFGVSQFINYYKNFFDLTTGEPLFKKNQKAKLLIEKDIMNLVRLHNEQFSSSN